jgi:hypothetical protein
MQLKIIADLGSVLDLIHDRWFDLEQVSFDRQKCEVNVYLGDKRKGPYHDGQLKITGVLSLDVKDEAKIGIYDLCEIKVDIPLSSILIIRLSVSDQIGSGRRVLYFCLQVHLGGQEKGTGRIFNDGRR